ncbi:MAG TPA: protein kinase [Pseudonocardia sp.]|jgi:hypothetical protein|uniref:protein kinase domain-containing protein n=1 Tax=Pseudonocardia sp. TaxID=60912 RepID=UPI002B4AD2E7|nr:protein kinase [Pseudonocardia sp.]HLU53859.1 protein kinase [Pseudonocardia sp.]
MTGLSPTRVIGGRYVVLGAAAPDAAGARWRAADRVTGREVAVAELHLPPGPDERRVAREELLRVARATGRLGHPAFVAVHDVVADGDVDHIVTELVDAPTIADTVAADGPLDERAATGVARQLAAALHAAHSAGVVHGDVGPHTVRIGPDGRVRLAAAGLAAALGHRPHLLAPELREGGRATAESDVWALGATVHVALTGTPPVDGVAPGVATGALGSALAGSLEAAPRNRPTALQVVRALDAGSRARARRRWWPVAGAAAVGLLAGLAAGFALAQPRVEVLTYGADGDVRLGAAATCLDAAPAPGAVLGPADCAGPHGGEIVASVDPHAERFPGPDALGRIAAAACPAASEAVGDRADLVALVPTGAAFGAGEREVLCVARSPAKPG